MANYPVIVIGASAGGIEALTNLLIHLPETFSAPIFIVIHIPPQNRSYLPDILSCKSRKLAINPGDGEAILPNKIYVAPPDKHMLIEKDVIRLMHGPKVNHTRPAIDPLFRSAALHYGHNTIGIILSGLLDDGTAGLLWIKRRGGITLVQDPEEAKFPDMPNNAMNYVPVDYCLSVKNMAALLAELDAKVDRQNDIRSISDKWKAEVKMDITPGNILDEDMRKISLPSSYACPECHGCLWEIQEDNLLRFRCRVGHAYGVESLSASLHEGVEEALWAALRALEEKANLAMRIYERVIQNKDDNITAKIFAEKAELTKHYADMIRKILLSNSKAVGT